MEAVDAVVIGAGVVGLACARTLALRGREVLILERHASFGTETSARNSEVIHAGLYYPPGSRKASLCVAGNRSLYAFCEERGIAHRRCGKLVVATEAGQEEKLQALCRQGRANGVEGLALLSAVEARRLEPALSCRAALLSPATGIVDSHALMVALLGEAEGLGATLVLRTRVTGGRIDDHGIVLSTEGAESFRLRARTVVNSAGLSAPAVAAGLGGFPQSALPLARYAKGSYFTLAGRAPFSHLVYPLPVAGGLGIHLTLDLGGQARFGPDVQWVEEPDYQVDSARAGAFAAEVRRYWPDLPEDGLAPGYAGVRPKIAEPGEAPADFVIQGPADHGLAGLVNLFGIESPGLTSCLTIAEAVAATVT